LLRKKKKAQDKGHERTNECQNDQERLRTSNAGQKRGTVDKEGQ